MKTIETKPGVTLGFIACPEGYENLSLIVPKGSRFGWKQIGKLSEITEEQAKELVLHPEDVKHGDTWYPLYKDYTGLVLTRSPIRSLCSAAGFTGIEEKDYENYLVIKL
jgi:hypothetical protein